MSTEKANRPLVIRLALGVILGAALCSAAAFAELEVPLTPHGAAPAVYRGSTHPDSIEAQMAVTGCITHRPLSIATCYRGWTALSGGDFEGAGAYWHRAAQLDGTLVTPHLAAARHLWWRKPQETASGLLHLPERLYDDFLAQQLIASNLFIVLFFSMLLAAVVTAVFVFGRHIRTLHHLFWEHAQVVFPRRVAKWTVWGVLALPLLWNLGWLLWAVILLAAAYPILKTNERRFAAGFLILVLITPLGLFILDDLVAPADPTHPVPTLWRAQHSGYCTETVAELDRLQQRYPEEGALYFTESLLARQGNLLDRARVALAQSETFRPLPDDRFLSAWGILAYRTGDVETAIRRFVAAVEQDPKRFLLRYNLSKAYARASLFLKADREMRTAFHLNSRRVRSEERLRLLDQSDDLIEERLTASDLWRVLARSPQSETFAMPRSLALLFPGQNPVLLWPGMLLIPLVLTLSTRWHGRLRVHSCCQCGRTVCRRCMKRRERRVFCAECALSAGRWANAQYTQLLLSRLLGRHDRWRDHLLDLGRFGLPGLGAILRNRTERGFVQLFLLALAVIWLATGGLPIKPLPWTYLDEISWPAHVVPLILILCLEAWVVSTELHGMRKRSNLKRFLGTAQPDAQQRDAA